MKGTPVGRNHRRHGLRAGIGIAVATLTLAAGAGEAAADKLEVTTKAGDGQGSFAAAVKKANKKQGGDQIRFAKSLRGKIDLPEETVTLTGKVVIEGNGYGSPDGKSFGRLVLSGHRGGSTLLVAEDGKASLRGLYLDGAALRAERGSDLTVQDSFLDGERTVDETGIESGSGELRVLGTTVRSFDVGVIVGGVGRIDQSTIADNVGFGGVLVWGSADVSNTTISGNVASGDPEIVGGGLDADGGEARVVNSTIVGNEAIGSRSRGGGVFGDVEVINSTISGNRAASGAGIAGSGGDADVANSIVFGNTGFDGTPADCADPFTSRGGNVIGAPGECVLDPGDVSTDPLLGPLADNGGPTETMAIDAGSPAIGLAVESIASKFDQRGVRRGSDPDAGAFQSR